MPNPPETPDAPASSTLGFEPIAERNAGGAGSHGPEGRPRTDAVPLKLAAGNAAKKRQPIDPASRRCRNRPVILIKQALYLKLYAAHLPAYGLSGVGPLPGVSAGESPAREQRARRRGLCDPRITLALFMATSETKPR